MTFFIPSYKVMITCIDEGPREHMDSPHGVDHVFRGLKCDPAKHPMTACCMIESRLGNNVELFNVIFHIARGGKNILNFFGRRIF